MGDYRYPPYKQGNYRVPMRLWVHGEYKPWYSYSLPMEGKSGTPKKIPSIQGHECPHCNTNNASLQRNMDDIYCFICGYRWSFYFKPKVDKWINWVERLEKENGAPILLSDREQTIMGKWEGYHQNYYKQNREKLLNRNKAWNESHKDQMREYSKQWKRNNSQRLNAERREKRALQKINENI